MPDWSQYSKLIAALVGNIVGFIVMYLAIHGFGTCTTIGDASTCIVWGIPEHQIEAGAMIILNALLVHQAPANS